MLDYIMNIEHNTIVIILVVRALFGVMVMRWGLDENQKRTYLEPVMYVVVSVIGIIPIMIFGMFSDNSEEQEST
jgi:hypothetical protein